MDERLVPPCPLGVCFLFTDDFCWQLVPPEVVSVFGLRVPAFVRRHFFFQTVVTLLDEAISQQAIRNRTICRYMRDEKYQHEKDLQACLVGDSTDAASLA